MQLESEASSLLESESEEDELSKDVSASTPELCVWYGCCARCFVSGSDVVALPWPGDWPTSLFRTVSKEMLQAFLMFCLHKEDSG